VHIKFCSKKAKRRDHSEDIGVDERIILKWTLGKWGPYVCGLDASGSGQWRVLVNMVINYLGSIKGREFLD
jgi:hypothetical protein